MSDFPTLPKGYRWRVRYSTFANLPSYDIKIIRDRGIKRAVASESVYLEVCKKWNKNVQEEFVSTARRVYEKALGPLDFNSQAERWEDMLNSGIGIE